ncbi:2'-5' RNA ligase family protein [Streptomyces albidoflavus]|uniref:2'-5' RNA ligase family protein n=1 Tax=Streptomyces albidoflavus TaxID=1886 RepID=UPI000A1CEB41|nr:2'-5' RNA ligase family protein [Streptomyces albidoflavus]
MPPAPTSRAPAPRKGICRAIFAVTGVVDEVADLIVPGAFAHTLATRPVKTVWHHEWKQPIGVVLEIAEWQPGDPRFADIPNWPAEAGALVATIQFNLRTSKGRDVYEQVRQWHEHGEAQFSIGYRVPPSAATKRSDGVRVIHKLDLYEVSPVLHGAHPLTRSIEVKADPGSVELEHKTTASSGHIDVKAAEQQVGRGVMVALYIPAGIAGKIAHRDGTAPRDLHITLAYLGDADQLPGHPDDLANIVAAALDGAAPLTGKIGGIGRFPDAGDGEPVFVPVDVPGLGELRERVIGALSLSPLAGALRTDHGFTPHITLGYGLPADTPVVPPLPITFDTVHVVRGPDATPIRLTGPAAADKPLRDTGLAQSGTNGLGLRASVEAKSARAAVLEAKAAGGLDKNRGDAEQLRHWYVRGAGAAQIAWGTAGDFDRCVRIAGHHMSPDKAKGYCNLRHRDATGIYPATHAAEAKSARAAVLEAKSRITPGATVSPIQPLPASYEEIRDRVGAAARRLLATEDGTWTCVEATYPDRAIVSVHQDGTDPVNYAVPYDSTGPEISLGTPQPVELTTVVIPEQGPARAADDSETTDSRVVRPTMRALADATARIQAADGAQQLEPVRATVGELLAALSSKGLNVGPSDEVDQQPTAAAPSPMAGNGIDLWDDPYDEPHDSAPAIADGPDSDEDDGEDTVRLNADDVKAQLAAIQG